jgi:hypothetical protein
MLEVHKPQDNQKLGIRVQNLSEDLDKMPVMVPVLALMLLDSFCRDLDKN